MISLPNPALGLKGQPRDTTLAMCLWMEARGETVEGMAAVACVILNRAAKQAKDVKEIMLAPKQFSGFNDGDPNGPASLDPIAHGGAAAWNRATAIASLALNGALKDITNGALNYFNPNIVHPPWAEPGSGWVQTAVIGGHVFGIAGGR